MFVISGLCASYWMLQSSSLHTFDHSLIFLVVSYLLCYCWAGFAFENHNGEKGIELI